MARVVLITGASRGIGARTILWLASDEASYITGTIVNCSGGC
jgi:NAD(P)-dependent dehydrogenase (short-subunit alcohol dehydrogenase family)